VFEGRQESVEKLGTQTSDFANAPSWKMKKSGGEGGIQLACFLQIQAIKVFVALSHFGSYLYNCDRV
jgi:hypothetical protein